MDAGRGSAAHGGHGNLNGAEKAPETSSHLRLSHTKPSVSSKPAAVVNAVTGTLSLSVPIFTSPGRSNFGPNLSLTYNSGLQDGVFGLGWSLDTASVTRKTSHQLPRYGYDGGEDEDVFVLSGTDDLVPVSLMDEVPRDDGWRVRRYYPRVMSEIVRVERWMSASEDDAHWRVTSGDNITSVFGRSDESRVLEPPNYTNGGRKRIFSWLISDMFDSCGNAIHFTYKAEDSAGVDSSQMIYEQDRLPQQAGQSQRYLKSIKYGNRIPNRCLDTWAVDQSLIPENGWLFELILDYGEHDKFAPTTVETQQWDLRREPFSEHKSGFEVRTYRLCRRILMFHHMPEQFGGVSDVLVSSTEFEYDELTYVGGAPLLLSITECGHGPGLAAERLPPRSFEYAEPEKNITVHIPEEADSLNIAYAVAGIAAGNAEWLDLDGEGSSGFLTRQSGAWWYQRNESATVLEDGKCRFSPPSLVAQIPHLTSGRLHFMDLTGHGKTTAVGEVGDGGYWHSERTEDGRWTNPLPFLSLPKTVDLLGDKTWMADLTGNGVADIIHLTGGDGGPGEWYPSLAASGFGNLLRMAAPYSQPVLLRPDDPQSYSFGRTRATEDSGVRSLWQTPLIADFTHERLRLADISGSGTTDLLYLPPGGGAWIYYNRAGNRWTDAQEILGFPALDSLASVRVMDLLGQGTTCLCWFAPCVASPVPAGKGILQYINLMSGNNKPGLLRLHQNGMGLQTCVTYSPSTRFYLNDERLGNPWTTRLPFPVQCVEKIETTDLIMQSTETTTYAYHDGYYDGPQREFRGFAMVEQWDTQEFSTSDAQCGVFRTPTVRSKRWFHLGRFPPKPANIQVPAPSVMFLREPDVDEPTADAYRSLKGHLVCEEVYSDDDFLQPDPAPYYRQEHNYRVITLQAGSSNIHKTGVYRVVEKEHLNSQLERGEEENARLKHDMILQVDDYGRSIKMASISYGREASMLEHAGDRTKQQETVVVYSEVDYTNPKGLLKFSDLVADDFALFRDVPELNFERANLNSIDRGKVLIDKARTLYLSSDLSTTLPRGRLEAHSVVDQTFKLAMTPGILSSSLSPVMTKMSLSNLTDALKRQGGYCDMDGDQHWWIPSDKSRFAIEAAEDTELDVARRGFYIPAIHINAFGSQTHTDLDVYSLFPVAQRDALGNSSSWEYDYAALTAKSCTDPNGNRQLSAFDALRRIVGTAMQGKLEEAGVGDSLDGFQVQLTGHQIDQFISDPVDHDRNMAILGKAYQRIIYRAAMRQRSGSWSPASVATMARDKHTANEAQIGVELVYQNGRGNAIQTSSFVDRQKWQLSGRTLYDAGGNPVRGFRAVFGSSHALQPPSLAPSTEIDWTMLRDHMGRVIGVLHADHTWNKVRHLPWATESFSTGDTVLIKDPRIDADVGLYFQSIHQDCYMPSWHTAASGSANRRVKAAAVKSETYHGTPTLTYSDSVGQTIAVVEDNGATGVKYTSRTDYGLHGNPIRIEDARGTIVAEACFDMCSRQLYRVDCDSGQRWALTDCQGRPLLAWDALGRRRRFKYDALGRLEEEWLAENAGDGHPVYEALVTKFVFGESVSDASRKNLRTKMYRCYDQAGMVQSDEFDFKGNCIRWQRRLAEDYKNIIDWSKTGKEEPRLEAAVFAYGSEFNARNQNCVSTAPDGSRTRRFYSADGRLQGLAFTHGPASSDSSSISIIKSIDYTPDNKRQRVEYGNEIISISTFSATTRQVERSQIVRQSSRSCGANYKNLRDVKYTYDVGGRMVDARDNAAQDVYFRGAVVEAAQAFTYDAIGRLVEARGREQVDASFGNRTLRAYSPADSCGRLPGAGTQMSQYVESYRYDAAGNILSLEHAAAQDPSLSGWTRKYHFENGSNRLKHTTVGNARETYDYDEHGCMTAAAPYYTSLSWDFKNHLRSSSTQIVKDGSTPETTWYVYDANGQRVRKVTDRCSSPGGAAAATKLKETMYLGEYQIYRFYRGDGTTTKSEKSTSMVVEAPGSGKPVALMEYDSLPRETGEKGAMLQRYQATDTLELDEKGQVISYAEYSPFGSTTYSATGSDIEASRRYRFAGYERDQETGMYHCGERYYAPWLGRWTSPDPVGVSDGLNRYCYVHNDPVGFDDSSGRMGNPTKRGAGESSKDTGEAEKFDPTARKKTRLAPMPTGRRAKGASAGATGQTTDELPLTSTEAQGRPAPKEGKTIYGVLGKGYDTGQAPTAYVRFQKPRPGQNPEDARINQKDWDIKDKAVARTINNFGKPDQINRQLWLPYNHQGLEYAGYLGGLMRPQPDLKADDVQITIIIPKAVENKLERIDPDRSILEENDNGHTDDLIFGIKTKESLQDSDFVYATGKDMHEAIVAWGIKKENKFIELRVLNWEGTVARNLRLPMSPTQWGMYNRLEKKKK
ncbi:Toxin subunit YenB-like protein [Cladobotryum mycophilum]|uniref:Toxin subunit YenB-like protein n=1 Tax=Cladobotryum mycophilum TaxID=491253 RepID=A0ABR0SWF8_9HYPO